VGGGGQEGEGDKASTSRDSRLDCVEGGGSWDAKFEELALFQAEHGHDLVPKQGACDTLQHTAAHCSTLPHTAAHCNTLQRTATHYNTMQHATSHCSTLSMGMIVLVNKGHTAAHCSTLQCTARSLQHAATTTGMVSKLGACKTLKRIAALQHTATHCSTLQNSAALCSTL